jgi:hypothetical protein
LKNTSITPSVRRAYVESGKIKELEPCLLSRVEIDERGAKLLSLPHVNCTGQPSLLAKQGTGGLKYTANCRLACKQKQAGPPAHWHEPTSDMLTWCHVMAAAPHPTGKRRGAFGGPLQSLATVAHKPILSTDSGSLRFVSWVAALSPLPVDIWLVCLPEWVITALQPHIFDAAGTTFLGTVSLMAGALYISAQYAALLVRLIQAVTIRTAFAPDEYWQSIEVAHRLVFG